MLDRERVRAQFQRDHGETPRLFAAPGRVNLIGEHTDYNDGFVLPIAIERETVVAAARGEKRVLRVRSMGAPHALEIDLDATPLRRRGTWADYVEGIARSLEARGVRLSGAKMVIDSDVPAGAGLSSSAALEVSVAMALLGVSGCALAPRDVALAGQAAEHEFVGTRCGIMDQFIAALGKADHALLVDCRALTSELVPLDGQAAAVLVCDTRVKHDLASSAYNERRAECERAMAILRRVRPDAAALRDISVEEFERYEDRLPEPERRRARHVIGENARTLRAAEALRRGDLEGFGKLMFASHRSLCDDYEVSAPELDWLVHAAEGLEGVYGARMTGGGFGGCTVNLVVPEDAPRIADALARAMHARFGRSPEIFVTRANEGSKEVFV